ncbi:alpha/beta fold hydrolase [Streptomyces sp. NPDC048416]|uniref:alpha/beta fold hydrolase n=1 Tax=Streptomyces sp. NPDC048416 TaxID=3365546 RepID=UPI0037207D50
MSRAGAGAGAGAVRRGVYAPPAPDRVLTAHSADGTPLHVEVHGPADAPAVVLAHGWTCSTAFWAAQIRALAGEYRVIAYDQRGHGRTAAAEVCSTDVLADDLEAVLDAALAPGERAVLAGHSMGGMTLMAAADRPGLRAHAAAVLLCSTGASRLVAESLVLPMRAGRVRTWLTRRVLGSGAPLGPVTPLAKKVLRYATMGPGASPDKVEACARIVHACPRGARQAWSQVLAELEVGALVGELRVPTAVVAGSADRLTPPVHARWLAEALPDCHSLDVLTGVGHMTPVEAPEFITEKIHELVRTHLAAPADAGAGAGAGVTVQADAAVHVQADTDADADAEESAV